MKEIFLKKLDKIIVVIAIAKKDLELHHISMSWKYFMCLDIPPLANDILKITRNFLISKIYIIL